MAIIPKSVNPDFFPRGGGPKTITLPDGTVIPIRGGGPSCPALNEEVLLADQSWILAKDLKVGDEVATHLGSNKVTYIDILKDKTQKEVIFTNGKKENSIVTSDTHPYYVENEKGFVEVKNLKIGDKVGEFSVKKIKDAGKGSVAHISIDEAQTYFLKAGDEAVLSHNKTPALPKTPRGPKFPTIGGGSLVPPPRIPIPRGPDLPIKNPMDDFPFGRRRKGLGGLFGLREKPKGRRKGLFGKGISGLLGRLKEKMPMVETMQEEMMMPMRGGMMDVNTKEMIFPRMKMAGGLEVDKEDYEASTKSLIDFLNSDPNQVDFGFVRNLVKEIILNPERTISNQERQMLSQALERNPNLLSDQELSIISEQMMKNAKPMSIQEMQAIPESRKYGDAIKGYAEGDEVSMMMMELEGDEDGMQEEAIKELEAARPEFEMMQQLAQVVINLIEQGASQEEIVAILKEQGLDDEDIQTLLEFVNEMMGQAEKVGMAEEDIGSQLAALG